MPQVNGAVENTFSNGYVTEASVLNFPERAFTDGSNCVINNNGSASRRNRFDLELDYVTKTIARADKAISSYVWENVNGEGDVTLLVKQVGATLYFYEMLSSTVSEGALVDTVTLTPVSGTATVDLEVIEAQFTDGYGYLIVTHPLMDPIRVSFDADLNTVSETTLTLKIRDFEGAEADPYDIDERPVVGGGTNGFNNINVNHKYNLYNQSWTSEHLLSFMGVSGQTKSPSNADVMWKFKGDTGELNFSLNQLNKVVTGNSPASKGHYILTLANQDRNAASGLNGIASTTTGTSRPSTCAFFAGRAFYAGIAKPKFNSKIFFTQIIERNEQFEHAYQLNDPTSEETFDLLPTDGGVIDIQEAGTIIKMSSMPGGLLVNATNGVWFISGSQGIGFAATDYSVQKVSSIGCDSHTSFVDIQGATCWWNNEGIWIASAGQGGPSVVSLTEGRLDTFYDAIPLDSKKYVRGFYNKIDGTVTWLYKSTEGTDLTDKYEFDRALIFHTGMKCFFPPWTISESDCKVHGGFYWEAPDGVMAKYLISYLDGSDYKFTFADTSEEVYKDWLTYDTDQSDPTPGTNYESTFTTGYSLRGNALNYFQTPWTVVYCGTTEDVEYYFQGIWNTATTPNSTGKWSTKQYVTHTNNNYSTTARKLKVRGRGRVLQFKVSSVDDSPFHILGWAVLNSSNNLP